MIYDLIGTIYKQTGVLLKDEEQNEYPEMKAVDGYHVNTLPPLAESLEQYVVTPETQVRVFAGRDDTICLKFSSRDEWLGLGYEEVEHVEEA